MGELTSVHRIIDQRIHDLTELKRMAGDPSLLEVMRSIVAAAPTNGVNGHRNAPPKFYSNGHHESSAATNHRSEFRATGLTSAVRAFVESAKGPFSISDATASLKNSGFRFTAASPRIAVSAPIRAMHTNGELRLVREGKGNAPNLYEFAGRPQQDLGV